MANRWDEKFASGGHDSPDPDPFFVESWAYWNFGPEPTALDLACGAGRHSRFLAQEGFAVTAVDFSKEGLRIAAERTRDLAVELVERDLEAGEADLGEEEYDLVVVVNYLHRPLFPALKRAVRPGGLVVYKTYLSGLSNPDYLLQPNELLRRFEGYRVLRYQEELKGRATAAILAQKPESA